MSCKAFKMSYLLSQKGEWRFHIAARPGIEPRFGDSESAVLPLDDLAIDPKTCRYSIDSWLVRQYSLICSWIERVCTIIERVLWQLPHLSPQRPKSEMYLRLILPILIKKLKNQRLFARSLRSSR